MGLSNSTIREVYTHRKFKALRCVFCNYRFISMRRFNEHLLIALGGGPETIPIYSTPTTCAIQLDQLARKVRAKMDSHSLRWGRGGVGGSDD